MAEPFYIGGYWAQRPESVEACADRLHTFLTALARAHPLLGTWFRKGYSRRAALRHQVEPTPEALRTLLLAGRNRRDDDRSVIEELGFSTSMWNGNDIAVGLMVHVGMYPAVSLPNSVVMNLPKPEGAALALYTPAVAGQIVEAVVSAWDATWATWSSAGLRHRQGAAIADIVVGWQTYLAAGQAVRDCPLPAGVTTDPLGSGLRLTIGKDPGSPPEALVVAVRGALDDLVHWWAT